MDYVCIFVISALVLTTTVSCLALVMRGRAFPETLFGARRVRTSVALLPHQPALDYLEERNSRAVFPRVPQGLVAPLPSVPEDGIRVACAETRVVSSSC